MRPRPFSPLIPMSLENLRRPYPVRKIVHYNINSFMFFLTRLAVGSSMVVAQPITEKRKLDILRQRAIRFMKSEANAVKKKEFQVLRDRANYVWILRTY